MPERQKMLSNMPHPGAPHEKKKSSWKKPFAILFGLVGVMASTGTVVGMLRGWFDPAPTADELAAESAEKLEQIEQRLTAQDNDTHLVNQVSRRVTELGDQFKRIQTRMKDIRRLERSLATQGSKKQILTPGQMKLREAARKKETEELLALVRKTEKMAVQFVSSVEDDDTLGQVTSTDSQTAQTKARALQQAQQIQSRVLPELRQLLDKHGD